jgi:hypothetical protein
MLPMALDGPSIAHQRHGRLPRMGPTFTWEMLPKASNGPSFGHECLELAGLTIAHNAHKRHYRCSSTDGVSHTQNADAHLLPSSVICRWGFERSAFEEEEAKAFLHYYRRYSSPTIRPSQAPGPSHLSQFLIPDPPRTPPEIHDRVAELCLLRRV